jgi:hypothetical protein
MCPTIQEELAMKKLKFFDSTNSLDPFMDEVIVDLENKSHRILVCFSAAPVKGADIFEILQSSESVKDFNASVNNGVHYAIELEGRYTEHAGVVSADMLETATLTTVATAIVDGGHKRRNRVLICGLPSAPGSFDSLKEFNEWIVHCPFTIDVWFVAKEG